MGKEENGSFDLFDAFGIIKATTVLKVKPENLSIVEFQRQKVQRFHSKF